MVIKAKLDWLEIQARKVKGLNLYPKQAWDVAKTLRRGLSHHHKRPQSDKLRQKDGSLSKTDNNYTKIFRDHFRTVFSRKDLTFNPTVLDSILSQPVMLDLNCAPMFEELLLTLRKASNHKAPGSNHLPMNVLKALSLDISPHESVLPHACPIMFVLEILISIWDGGLIPEEWRFGVLCPIYKLKGEATNQQNWRPICLLDMTYKILAAIITERMNHRIRIDGLEEQ